MRKGSSGWVLAQPVGPSPSLGLRENKKRSFPCLSSGTELRLASGLAPGKIAKITDFVLNTFFPLRSPGLVSPPFSQGPDRGERAM